MKTLILMIVGGLLMGCGTENLKKPVGEVVVENRVCAKTIDVIKYVLNLPDGRFDPETDVFYAVIEEEYESSICREDGCESGIYKLVRSNDEDWGPLRVKKFTDSQFLDFVQANDLKCFVESDLI